MTYVVVCINPALKRSKPMRGQPGSNRGVDSEEQHVFGPFSLKADAFREAANADKDCTFPHIVSIITGRYT